MSVAGGAVGGQELFSAAPEVQTSARQPTITPAAAMAPTPAPALAPAPEPEPLAAATEKQEKSEASNGDCGRCANCLDKVRFGGPGLKHKACVTKQAVPRAPSAVPRATNPVREARGELVVPTPLAPVPAEEAEELVATLERMQNERESRRDECHGWVISYAVRSKQYAKESKKRGDLVVTDPRDGERLHSVLAVKRKLGLVTAVEGLGSAAADGARARGEAEVALALALLVPLPLSLPLTLPLALPRPVPHNPDPSPNPTQAEGAHERELVARLQAERTECFATTDGGPWFHARPHP